MDRVCAPVQVYVDPEHVARNDHHGMQRTALDPSNQESDEDDDTHTIDVTGMFDPHYDELTDSECEFSSDDDEWETEDGDDDDDATGDTPTQLSTSAGAATRPPLCSILPSPESH